ncbi:MAG: DUF3524 domain-containing protein [Anaerolinea sp.]|nr:DUF3524 domain-containing protein [Anaerolinea sp.]
MRVLFIEPFYGGSHKAFADGLVLHSRHEIELLTLPEGEWRRRMRRGAQDLAAKAGELTGEFDLVLATDMLDVPTFLALTRPRFERTPLLYYLHENQFTYPRIRGTKLNSWFGQINYLSALAADAVAFNSEYHRQDFLGALRTLARQPNNWLVEESIGLIEAKSRVLPVGVDLAGFDQFEAKRSDAEPPLIVWNHRWEFDKAPEMFARVVERLAAAGCDFRLAILGDPGFNPSPVLPRLAESMPERLVQSGYAPGRARYAELLWESDIVVSTTRHEFFGVGMVEAMYCGCVPCAPNSFTYPGLVPVELHATCLFESEDEFEAKLKALLADRPGTGPLRASAARFDWDVVARQWDAAIETVRSDFAGG